MDLLFLVVIGKSLNVSPTRWYLLLEKTLDAHDECKSSNFIYMEIFQIRLDLIKNSIFSAQPIQHEKLRAAEKMLNTYLTPEQIKRLRIFLRLANTGSNPIDSKILFVS